MEKKLFRTKNEAMAYIASEYGENANIVTERSWGAPIVITDEDCEGMEGDRGFTWSGETPAVEVEDNAGETLARIGWWEEEDTRSSARIKALLPDEIESVDDSDKKIVDGAELVLARITYKNGEKQDVPFVIYTDEGIVFSPSDWQADYSYFDFDDEEDMSNAGWRLGVTEKFAIMLGGLPRLL